MAPAGSPHRAGGGGTKARRPHSSSVVSIFLLFLVTRAAADSTWPVNLEDTLPYFLRYGYVSPLDNDEVQDTDVLVSALHSFQNICGIPQTNGIIDNATRECFNRPRCGNPDFLPEHQEGGRHRRYYIPSGAEGWSPDSTHLTYDIVQYSEDLAPTVIDDSIDRAFEVWSNATQLSFERIREGEVDISIYFYPSFVEHGDLMPFDGPGQVLAHAFWPWRENDRSDIHLDEAETWTSRSYSGANLWLVAAHEIGHALGLGHSVVFGTLMFPFHFGYDPDFTLHEDDFNGIQALYGDIQEAPTPVAPDAPDICLEVIDAIMVDGFMYIFKGDYFWKVWDGQPEPGYPQRIADRWPGLEGDIEAALTVKNDHVWGEHTGKTYFFKERRVWRYTLTSLDEGFPKDVDQAFPSFPSEIQEIKGIFEIGGNGETYIFTENGFYVRSWLGFHGPYELRAFDGVPANIVSALQWTDNYIYFFTDDFLYYQCSPWSLTVSTGYPRFAPADWMGCTYNLEGGDLRSGTQLEGPSSGEQIGPTRSNPEDERSSAIASASWTFRMLWVCLCLSCGWMYSSCRLV